MQKPIEHAQGDGKLGASTHWTYQQPRTPSGNSTQRYYREQRLDQRAALSTISLLRFAGRECAKLSLRVEADYGDAELTVTLERANLMQMRDAFNDALHEMEQEDQERDRAESFQQICDELNEAEASGQASSVYYCHPDVHYVGPGQEDAKVAELEAAGAPRFLVLTRPAAHQAATAEPPPPYPHRPAQWPEGLTHLSPPAPQSVTAQQAAA
jgi:hypothetical protein